jgi:HlyD family secretion protein
MQKTAKAGEDKILLIRKTLPPSLNNRKTIMIALAGTLVIIGMIVAFFLTQNHGDKDWKKNTAAVTRRTVQVQVTATGTIRPYSEVKVSPKQTGLLQDLFVKQGDFVKAGQAIAVMDSSNLRAQIEASQGAFLQAQHTYERALHGNRPQEVAVSKLQERRAESGVRGAEQNVTKLRAQVASAQANLQRDELLERRQTMLAQQGAISDQDRVNATTQASVSRANLQAAQEELKQAEATLAQSRADVLVSAKQRELSTIGNRPEDIAIARDQMMQAKGNLDYLKTQLNDMTIRAPFDGVITQKYADKGAIVTPTTSAATTSATSSSIVALASQLEMVAQVSETDIAKVRVGQPVQIRATAYPDAAFHGKVSQIAPESVVTQNVTTFEVHSTIDDDNRGQLLSGMNVSASFETGEMPDALLVPTVSILSRRGRTGVLVPKADGKPEFRRIKVGPTIGNSTVVREGLKDGELVFLGLSSEQLKQQGYGSGGPGGGGGGRGGGGGGYGGAGGGGGGGAPIPRSFGR